MDFLPGTEVLARGLPWEVVETQPQGQQTRVRLRGVGAFAGYELDVLTPFERVEPVAHNFDPTRAGTLPNWIVYHQAFLLEQALGPDAFLAVQPGRLRLEPYQLVPLARALRMSRPRLLLADDVGLGKTIEAGLIIAELMARRRVHRLLVVTPAGPLLEQWKIELAERFGLRLGEANRSAIERIQRGTELGSNPFDHLPLAIASMDFLKQDRVLDEVERALPYDLIVIDEAHHYAETGQNDADRSEASQRRRLGEVLARKSDALLLLTATPHDGYDRSFASLLELLDLSLTDGKGRAREAVYHSHVVRRLKKHIKIIHPQTGELVGFPERKVIPVKIELDRMVNPEFVELHMALLRFIAPELKRALRSRRYDDTLAYLALLKRSTSSVVALRNTLLAVQRRMAELATTKQEEIDAQQQRRKSLQALRRKMARFGALTLDEEEERDQLEQEDLAQQLSLLERESGKTRRDEQRAESAAGSLAQILEKAESALGHDVKIEELVAEVKAIRKDEPGTNIVIYTEYVDSLHVVEARLKNEGVGHVLTIHGAGHDESDDRREKVDRSVVTDRFRTQDNLVLVSTDAAAEGLNLHQRCHHLIHVELPWNPNRLEQRNGRIDRYGQWRTPTVRYLYLCGTFEERILARLMAKYERQRNRLKFMPNTLGFDVSDLPQEGLFAALAESVDAIGNSCRPLEFIEGTDDSDDPDVKALLEEVENSLNRFEHVAKTHKWLAEEGAAADEISQRQARQAFDIGSKVGGVDLVAFVGGAVLSEGGQVVKKDHWLDIVPPPGWDHWLAGLPGWNDRRLRLTTDMDRLTDDHDEPVGYLGRAHPLVRRAIEHARHLALGQGDGLDRRISAARSPDGQHALMFTLVGQLRSEAGRELERIMAVRVMPDMQVDVVPDGTKWLPEPETGLPTRGLWEREFKAWGADAQTAAVKAAQNVFSEIAEDFSARHKAQLEAEQRDLDAWLAQRADEIVGRAQAELPLFQQMPVAVQSPLERLADHIVQVSLSSREKAATETTLSIYRTRSVAIKARATLSSPTVTPVGVLMQGTG